MYQHSETLKIGKIYKGIREAMGLSQEDVSAGLMSAKALSSRRYQPGRQPVRYRCRFLR